jgi:hypothetical protein
MGEHYGSELIGTCGGTLEITMLRQPSSREQALRLACDLKVCAEEPERGDWNHGQLAAYLTHAGVINFWWD